MGSTRDRWSRLVKRWRRSGQTARQFAKSAGLNAGTLSYWAWRLKREGSGSGEARRRRRHRSASRPAQKASFVELIVDRPEQQRFELELGDGRRLHIPAAFEAAALGRLLGVLTEAGR